MIAREIIEEQTAHAGVMRQRVLSLVDRLHRTRAINFEQFAAGTLLRDLIMQQLPPSQGVSSYGNSIGQSDPATKSDRWGQRLTGFRISYDGLVSWAGGRKAQSEQRRLEDALFAAVGTFDDLGAKRVNPRHADILVRVVLVTDEQPTLANITRELTDYYGINSRRVPAFALGVVSTWLGRLALHFRLTK